MFRNVNNDGLHQPEFKTKRMYNKPNVNNTRNCKMCFLLFLLKVVVQIVRVVQGGVEDLDVSGLYHNLFKPNLKETVSQDLME